jgi:hypothetical protein
MVRSRDHEAPPKLTDAQASNRGKSAQPPPVSGDKPSSV